MELHQAKRWIETDGVPNPDLPPREDTQAMNPEEVRRVIHADLEVRIKPDHLPYFLRRVTMTEAQLTDLKHRALYLRATNEGAVFQGLCQDTLELVSEMRKTMSLLKEAKDRFGGEDDLAKRIEELLGAV